MSTRKVPLPDGSEVVDPGDGTEPFVSRKEGFWWVKRKPWRGTCNPGPGAQPPREATWEVVRVEGEHIHHASQEHPCSHVALDPFEWGPFLGTEPPALPSYCREWRGDEPDLKAGVSWLDLGSECFAWATSEGLYTRFPSNLDEGIPIDVARYLLGASGSVTVPRETPGPAPGMFYGRTEPGDALPDGSVMGRLLDHGTGEP